MRSDPLAELVSHFDDSLNELTAAHDEAAEQSPLPESVYVASCRLFQLVRRLKKFAEEQQGGTA